MKSPETMAPRLKPKQKRILIVNGQTVRGEAIRRRIDRAHGLDVCGESFSEEAALREIDRWRPDLVLTEILPRRGIGFIRRLRREHPQLPVLVYSFGDDGASALRAVAAGARCCLMKRVDDGMLIRAVRKALNGRRHWPAPTVAAGLSGDDLLAPRSRPRRERGWEKGALAPRDRPMAGRTDRSGSAGASPRTTT